MLFFSSRRRHTRCALVTGVQTCALPICILDVANREPPDARGMRKKGSHMIRLRKALLLLATAPLAVPTVAWAQDALPAEPGTGGDPAIVVTGSRLPSTHLTRPSPLYRTCGRSVKSVLVLFESRVRGLITQQQEEN